MRGALERSRSKGVLGVAAETMTVCRSLWLPCLLLEVGCSRVDGVLRKRTKHTSIFNLYEGITGRLIASTEDPPALAEVDIGSAHFSCRIKARAFRVEAERAFMAWRSAVQDGARQRRAGVLAQLGIPLPNDAVTVTEIAQPYLPIGVAVLEGRGKRRVQVVGLRTGRRSDLLSTVVTANILILGDLLAA
jgi:hypothetical protein